MPPNGKFKDALVLAPCMKFPVLSACVGHQCRQRDKYSEYTTVTGHWPPAPPSVILPTRASNEGYPKVPEDFTITEKAPTIGPSPG